MMGSNLVLSVSETIKRYNMLSNDDKVVVGLSGGADSVTLLHSLNTLKTEYNLTLIAAHVNHGLRGEEAKRDEDFSKNLALSLEIPFKVLHADVPALVLETGESFETCGRNVRYNFFKEIATSLGGAKIATAHNAQDNLETVIFNLTRGSGLSGLIGIPPVREEEGYTIIRPIIECSREDIEEYLESINQSYVTDSTNSDIDYSRNRIRHKIVPELLSLNSAAVGNVTRCSNLLSQDEDYLKSCALKVVLDSRLSHGYSLDVLCNCHPAIQSRALRIILSEYDCETQNKKNIEMLKDLINAKVDFGKVQIRGGSFVTLKNGVLEIQNGEEAKHESPKKTIEVMDFSEALKLKINPQCIVDLDKLSDTYEVRTRREGDKFRVPYRNVTKTLKSLFQEKGISPEVRQELVMIEDNGMLAFVEGIGPAEGYVPNKNTKKVLYISKNEEN